MLRALGVVPHPSDKPIHVAIVSNNPETLAGLESYLAGVGVTARAAVDLTSTVLPPEVNAVVLFPDDYPRLAVDEFLGSLRNARPELFILVVTAAPQTLGVSVGPQGNSLPPVVLPKPAFGWTILDAIRAAAGRIDEGSS